MSLATALLTPILGDASPWTPQRLFVLGEAGGVYDPAQLTAEKVAWRRNLLTWSEDFTNAAWGKTNATITANAGTSWDGTATASKLTPTTTNAEHWISQTVAPLGALPHTFSFYAKADGYSVVQVLNANDATDRINFDLSTGLVGSATTYTGTITSVGGGWYRCTATYTTTTSVLAWARIAVVPSSTSARGAAFAGDGSSGVLIDSSQFELGSTATAYQRITDFTSDFLAAFPTHSLYQNVSGTTPVTALGQPVGLALDTKTGGLANLGATVIANGNFASGASWTAGTGWSIGSGVATKTAGTASVLSQAVTLTIPGTYRLVYTMTRSAGTLTPRLTGGTTVNATARTASGTYTEYVTTVTGNTTFEFSADASFAGTVDDVAFQLVPGVHAIQASDPSRPLLDARVNLFLASEAILSGGSPWSVTNGTTASNTTTAPNGTTTADTYTPSASLGAQQIVQSVTVGAAVHIQSVYAKANGYSFVQFNNSQSGTEFANFDISSGTVETTGGSVVASIEPVGNGWHRCSITYTAFSAAAINFRIVVVPAANSARGAQLTGDGTSGVHFWGADLRLAADAAYPYQRVTTATDYADVGVPRAFLFDGMDDSLYTASNMDLSGTDKVTVLAGVRKLSDAAAGAALVELSASPPTNNGTFGFLAPQGGGTDYAWRTKGTVDVLFSSGNYVAPITNAITGLANIAGDTASIRVNGVQVASSSSDQGTGNYGSYVLFIGRRNNATIPLNGKVYQLIVRGALTDAATLAQAERYVGARTGVFL